MQVWGLGSRSLGFRPLVVVVRLRAQGERVIWGYIRALEFMLLLVVAQTTRPKALVLTPTVQ